MKVEVIFHDRIAAYHPGQVAEIEEGPFLVSILLGGKADAINPPDWTLESYLDGSYKEKSGKPVPKNKK